MKQLMSARWSWICLAALTVLTAGCEEDPIFTKKFRSPPIRLRPKERLTVKKTAIKFVYEKGNKRDPFRPNWLTKAVRGAQITKVKDSTPIIPQRPKTPLEEFELDQLKVVAIVTGVANPFAMVEDPKGKGHMVRRGTLIGRNGGRVTRINPDGLIISLVYRDVTGKRVTNRVMLRLQQSQKQEAGSVVIGGRKVIFDGGRIRYSQQSSGLKSRTNRLFKKRGVGSP